MMQGYIELEVDVLKAIKGSLGKDFFELAEKLDTYWNKRISRNCYDYYYRIPEGSPLLEDLFEFRRNHKHLIDVNIWSVTADYTADELIKAKAYLPTLDINTFIEYEDVDFVYDQCKMCGGDLSFEASELWDGTIWNKQRVIKPEGKIKKEGKKLVLRSECDTNTLVVSECMHGALLNKGISEVFFDPAISKRGKLLGYEIVTNTVLPTESLLSKRFKLEKKCKCCGNSRFTEKRLIKYEPYYLNGLEELPADVCRTADFYYGRRLLLISPRLRNYIVALDKKASFLPVF